MTGERTGLVVDGLIGQLNMQLDIVASGFQVIRFLFELAANFRVLQNKLFVLILLKYTRDKLEFLALRSQKMSC
jgi:hypothetical protein